MADHRCDPTEPFEERKAFKERCINRFEQTEGHSIKRWNSDTLLPEQGTHRREMKFAVLQILEFSTDSLNIAYREIA